MGPHAVAAETFVAELVAAGHEVDGVHVQLLLGLARNLDRACEQAAPVGIVRTHAALAKECRDLLAVMSPVDADVGDEDPFDALTRQFG